MDVSPLDGSAAQQAAALIAAALDPKAIAARDENYLDSLHRLRTDQRFNELTKDIASGLGLYIAQATAGQLVLLPKPGGPFAKQRRAERTTSAQRGVLYMSLIATIFPTSSAMESATLPGWSPPVLTVQQLVVSLREHLKAAASRGDGRLAEAAASIAALPDDDPESQSRTTSVAGLLRRELISLVENGMLMKSGADDSPVYYPTARLVAAAVRLSEKTSTTFKE